MLELKNITKYYKIADNEQLVLKNINMKFNHNDFVAILGPSGSGKTTLLNIIGGLDHYDSGDLIINNKSTKNFKENDWDAYRNNCIGFIFQNYNLINHISILENVELALTLSGVTKKIRRKKSIEVLKKVGLENHINKKPNQLSGGQMQRVAIARALVNDPDIILADEPTGALDSKTSIQIMELIKEIAKDKLVIMVTHNRDLATKYANRIIEVKDGNIITDNYKENNKKIKLNYKIKKTSMNFLTALSLSFNNIKTKKGRTFLTAFAASIGIIGISIILSLSNGFDLQIDKFEKDTLANFPISISRQVTKMTPEEMMMYNPNKNQTFPNDNIIKPYDTKTSMKIHQNIITEEYMNYINNINYDDVMGLSYLRTLNLNMFINEKYVNSEDLGMISLPTNKSFLEDGYDLLYGEYPKNKTELVISLNSNNELEESILNSLGFNKEIEFKDIIGKEIKLFLNNDFYVKDNNYFKINNNLNYENAITLKIVGIVRGKKDNYLSNIVDAMSMNDKTGSILYSNDLAEYIININQNSEIAKSQNNIDYNIFTGEKVNKEEMLTYLGAKDIPLLINIYPKNFQSKTKIINYLNDYNLNKQENEKLIFTDLADMFSKMSSNIMDAIKIILIAFSAISLFVSSIMIGIITYISVLERTKEIGILRSIGARKKDISRVFNAETFIIGLTSGIIGIIISRLLLFPINFILKDLTELNNVAIMNPIHIIILIIISILLTIIGGYIPSLIASKKNPVEALRTE